MPTSSRASQILTNSRMVLAKESLMDPIDMHELLERGPVAVDARGESVHETGPRVWGEKIRALKIPVRVV